MTVKRNCVQRQGTGCIYKNVAGPFVGNTQLPDSGDILPLEEVERRYLIQVMSRFQGDRDSLADKLGVSKRTLFRKLQNLRASQHSDKIILMDSDS